AAVRVVDEARFAHRAIRREERRNLLGAAGRSVERGQTDLWVGRLDLTEGRVGAAATHIGLGMALRAAVAVERRAQALALLDLARYRVDLREHVARGREERFFIST